MAEERTPDAKPKDHPEQAAALQEGRQEESHTQDETADERLDTEQHSDAPGPFGTG